MKRIAISQSNYIPWKGYFDAIRQVDEFILYDEVQYTRRDWRNRNRIKTASGVQWLTIPVEVKGKFHQAIQDTNIADPKWGESHWKTISQAYAKAERFDQVAPRLEPLYLRPVSSMLSEVNRSFLELVCTELGIYTPLRWSREYQAIGDRNHRLLDICIKAGATDYYSGPSAKSYLDESLFVSNGIRVHYFDYLGYPEYPQLYGAFIHEVSILDLLLNMGEEANLYMKSNESLSRRLVASG